MYRNKKKILLSVLLCASMLFAAPVVSGAEENEVSSAGEELMLDCKSAILMEASTGTVLYEQNADESLPPASVTKIMTLLLVMEAIEDNTASFDDIVTASAHAASMGGSQIYLKEGEQMRLEDMLKSVVIASANDAAVALAEHICGSEETFVSRMNERAAELGMENTYFENTNGLDDTTEKHLTTARDIAIMSRELIKHRKVLEYSSLWMDTIRDGAFGLTNTNRLVRYYRGCTGLKTGSTAKAGFCVSVTANRDGMELICVIMGAKTRDERNAFAAKLLDWGYARYGVYSDEGGRTDAVRVRAGVNETCVGEYEGFSAVLDSKEIKNVTKEIMLGSELSAPVKKGDVIGSITYRCGDRVIGSTDILCAEEVERIGFWEILQRILSIFAIKQPNAKIY